MAFEETAEELTQNVRSLGFDLDKLVAAEEARRRPRRTSSAARSRRPASTTSTGCSSASGYAIDSIGAKRVVLDTIETLFGGFSNQAILRAELRRLFRWLKDKGVTAVITARARRRHAHAPGPRGVRLRLRDPARSPRDRAGVDAAPARRQVSRHRARHERVPVPDRRGRASRSCRSRRSGLDHEASDERISTGIPRLDAMLGGEGVYRGSSVLVTGTAGTGKSSLAAHFARTRCRARRALPLLRVRGVREPDRAQHALDRARPAALDQEGPAAVRRRAADRERPGDAPGADAPARSAQFQPRMVVVDPISNLADGGHAAATRRRC